jgi:orotate phosphoribosyltransferase
MPESRTWTSLLAATGAIQDGHFLLSSGRHSERYVQCARALELPRNAERMGRGMAALIHDPVDRVVAPPLGGLLIGYEVARHLGVPLAFPERGEDGAYVLRRGFELVEGERVCLVEDVITTGRTTNELIELVRSLGARTVAVAAIVDRSESHHVGGLPIRALLRLDIPTYAPAACPACRCGKPLYQPGSRQMRERETR